MTEAQRDGLSADLGIKHISVPDVLEAKSKDKTYPHADVLGDYLKEGIVAPADLIVGLLKEELEACKPGGTWYFIHGFPRNVDQFVQFEKRVQKGNHVLTLRSPSQLPTEEIQYQYKYWGPNVCRDPGLAGFELSRFPGPNVREAEVRRSAMPTTEDILTVTNRSTAISLRIAYTAN